MQATKTIRVLVVEDEALIGMIIENFLVVLDIRSLGR